MFPAETVPGAAEGMLFVSDGVLAVLKGMPGNLEAVPDVLDGMLLFWEMVLCFSDGVRGETEGGLWVFGGGGGSCGGDFDFAGLSFLRDGSKI